MKRLLPYKNTANRRRQCHSPGYGHRLIVCPLDYADDAASGYRIGGLGHCIKGAED